MNIDRFLNYNNNVSVSTFALYRITSALNWICHYAFYCFKLFALDHYHLRFLDIGYFFGTLDDISMTSQIMISLIFDFGSAL
ncbi:unnamed protein product [Rhizophagus irregularis]|nr:unnamed protein product [Rhizophagus irregularis]